MLLVYTLVVTHFRKAEDSHGSTKRDFIIIPLRRDGVGDSVRVIEPSLPEAAGYVIVIVIGFLIALIMMATTRLLKQTVGEDSNTTEMFIAANRSVGTGLTASAIIPSWLWSTAILGMESLVGYSFG